MEIEKIKQIRRFDSINPGDTFIGHTGDLNLKTLPCNGMNAVNLITNDWQFYVGFIDVELINSRLVIE